MKGLISGAAEVVRQKASDIKAESERRMHEDTIDISLGTYYYELEIRSGDSIARASFSGSDFGEVVAESDLAQRFVWSMLHLSGRRKVKSER
jgi:hypothetical protein